MHKFDVYFCQCGRIHVTPFSDIEWLALDNQARSVVRVCTNCGQTARIILETVHGDMKAYNPQSLSDGTFTGMTRFEAMSGIPVPLKSGKIATTFQSGYFVNVEEWVEQLEKHSTSLEDAHNLKKDWATVDTLVLIDEIQKRYLQDSPEVIKAIIRYGARIDWSGTPYI